MSNWKSVRVVFGALLLGLAVAATSNAWGVSHENYLTFNRMVSLPGVTLPAGSYVFDIANSTSTLDVVAVRTRDRRKQLFLGFTQTVERPSGMSKNTAIVFGEAQAGEPQPISTWYEIGSPLGHQFKY